MTDPAARMYRTGTTIGARKAIHAAVDHLRAAGHLEAARHLEDHASQVAKDAFTEPPRDRWSGAYAGAEARAEQATRDRIRDERSRGARIDVDTDA